MPNLTLRTFAVSKNTAPLKTPKETQEIISLATTVKRSASQHDIKPYPKFKKVKFLRTICKLITCKLIKEIINNRKT